MCCVQAVMDEAERMAKQEDPEAVRHALMVFITRELHATIAE